MPKAEKITRDSVRKDHQCGVRLTEKEFEEVRKLAIESGFTISSYIREIVIRFIANEK